MAELKSGTTIGGEVAYHSGNLHVSDVIGAIGTYAMCKSTTATAPGITVAGSALLYSDAAGTTAGTAPSGTWKAMGNCPVNQVTLFKRIS